MAETSYGQTCVVIGAGGGLGEAVCHRLLAEDWRVIAVSRSARNLQRAAAGFSGLHSLAEHQTACIDMSRPESVVKLQEVVAERSVEALVVSAGNGRPVQGGWTQRFQQMVDANINPALNALEALEGSLHRARAASVVLISSIAAYEWLACPPEYAASKAALGAFAGHLSRQWAPIRVNVLAPGNMPTTGSVWKKMEEDAPADLAEYLSSEVPLQRLGDPGEVAKVVRFLVSDESSFISGSTIIADGGQLRRFF